MSFLPYARTLRFVLVSNEAQVEVPLGALMFGPVMFSASHLLFCDILEHFEVQIKMLVGMPFFLIFSFFA